MAPAAKAIPRHSSDVLRFDERVFAVLPLLIEFGIALLRKAPGQQGTVRGYRLAVYDSRVWLERSCAGSGGAGAGTR